MEDFQFPKLDALRAEATQLRLEDVPVSVLRELEQRARVVVMQLKSFITANPGLGRLCGFEELEQSYQGTCDERSLLYNFAALNFSFEFKESLVSHVAAQLHKVVLKYPKLQYIPAPQGHLEYVIFNSKGQADRLASYGVMAFFAKLQQDEQFYDEALFTKRSVKSPVAQKEEKTQKSPKTIPPPSKNIVQQSEEILAKTQKEQLNQLLNDSLPEPNDQRKQQLAIEMRDDYLKKRRERELQDTQVRRAQTQRIEEAQRRVSVESKQFFDVQQWRNSVASPTISSSLKQSPVVKRQVQKDDRETQFKQILEKTQSEFQQIIELHQSRQNELEQRLRDAENFNQRILEEHAQCSALERNLRQQSEDLSMKLAMTQKQLGRAALDLDAALQSKGELQYKYELAIQQLSVVEEKQAEDQNEAADAAESARRQAEERLAEQMQTMSKKESEFQRQKEAVLQQQQLIMQLENQVKQQQKIIQQQKERIDAPTYPEEIQKQIIIDLEAQLVRKNAEARDLEFRLMQMATDDARPALQSKAEFSERELEKTRRENHELKKMNLELILDMERLVKK